MKRYSILALMFIFIICFSSFSFAYSDYDDYGYDDYYGYEEEYDDYESDPGTNILISIGVGLLIGFISVSSMKAKLTSVKAQPYASDYIVKDSMLITHKDDIFLYRNVSRTRRTNSRKD